MPLPFPPLPPLPPLNPLGQSRWKWSPEPHCQHTPGVLWPLPLPLPLSLGTLESGGVSSSESRGRFAPAALGASAWIQPNSWCQTSIQPGSSSDSSCSFACSVASWFRLLSVSEPSRLKSSASKSSSRSSKPAALERYSRRWRCSEFLPSLGMIFTRIVMAVRPESSHKTLCMWLKSASTSQD